MKFLSALRIFCLMCVSVAVLCAKQADQDKNIKNTEDSFIQNAVSRLKIAKDNKTGHFHRISCELRFCGDQLLEEVTKTYYTDYRKHPDCSVAKYAEGQPDRKLEVIYKNYEKNSLVVIDKRHKMKRQEKRIEFPDAIL